MDQKSQRQEPKEEYIYDPTLAWKHPPLKTMLEGFIETVNVHASSRCIQARKNENEPVATKDASADSMLPRLHEAT